MLAKQFIDQLETQGLLSPDIIEELRRQVADTKAKITPETLARILVDNGHLTKFQATKIVSDLKSGKDTSSAAAAPKSAKPTEKKSTSNDDLDLSFADEPQVIDDDAAEVILDDDDVEILAEEVDEVEAVEAVEVVPTEVEVADVEPEVVEVVEVVESVAAAPVRSRPSGSLRPQKSGGKAPAPVRSASNKPVKAGENPWDSHRIVTTAVLLGVVLVVGAGLLYYFTRTSAEEKLEAATAAYEARSYEVAATAYQEFVTQHGSHEKASFAKVRAALAALRRDVETASDPNIGLKTATEILPSIASEPGLTTERSDLASVLVLLAEKFTQRADAQTESEKKRSLMAEMEKLNSLINDPQYMSSTEKGQLGPKLARIEEDRQRILRDINRDEELSKTVSAVDAMLKEQKTAEAYQLRRELVDRYPQLEKDPQLTEQVQRATQIQQSLVSSTPSRVQVGEDKSAAAALKSITFANRGPASKPIAAMKGKIVYVKAKGTLYALSVDDGSVKWTYHTGRELADLPIRLGDGPAPDIVLSRPGAGQIARLGADSGKSKWFADLGGPCLAPTAEGDDVLVAMRDGNILSVDPESGQSKWSVKVPQNVEVSPGAAFGKPFIYVPGEHSNLYVLSRQDGKCKEVFYLGHRSGTIAVPPVLVLGQLFIFENRGADFSMVRILQTSDNGTELKALQQPIRLAGNVVVPPQVDGRKLIVSTDRGEIRVLDIEPTAEKDKVSSMTPIPATLNKPNTSWAAAAGNMLWVAGDRFTRYEVQVSRGQLVRLWNKDDGDEFTGPPQRFEDVVVHTRIVRGSRGVRVAAINGLTGDVLWQTDIGVPIASIAKGKDKPDVLTTSGALFTLDAKEPIRNESELNPDAGKIGLLYSNPTTLENGNVLLMNQSIDNRFAIYQPGGDKNRLRMAAANFFGGKPTSLPTAVGKNFVVGLDNGQLALVDPASGAYAAAPFQPPVEPTKSVAWARPVYFPGKQMLIATGNMQKIYRIGVGESLRSLLDVDIEKPVIGPLAKVGTSVLAVIPEPGQDNLVAIDSESLNRGKPVMLDGRWIAGPFAVSDKLAFIQTDKSLSAVGPDASIIWSIELPKSVLAAPPEETPAGIVAAMTNGKVLVLGPEDGKKILDVDCGKPLSCAPLVMPGGLLLGSDEGCVLTLPLSSGGAGGR
ncbi:MAG: PQQ-binding-like beta-propeller repeat protein [Pirellulales bacterium]